ncbi:MAG: PorT family protein, partial [Dysgonamonadaceae bacterium]|nr:PorT family protein [Dysgonamonadaceae bacterium]
TIPRYYDDDYTVRRKFDYGIAGGMGLEIRTGIGNFILEGRYYYGLSDVFNNSRADVFQSSHNQVIGIKLTYLVER